MIDDRVSVRPASPGPTLTLPIRVVYPKDLSVMATRHASAVRNTETFRLFQDKVGKALQFLVNTAATTGNAWSSYTFANAYAGYGLAVLSRSQKFEDRYSKPFVQWMSQQQGPGGSFEDTEDTAIAIAALSAMLDAHEEARLAFDEMSGMVPKVPTAVHRCFVGYSGKSTDVAREIKESLGKRLPTLEIRDWRWDFQLGRVLFTEIEKISRECEIAVFLVTKDDQLVQPDGDQMDSPRDNIVFEVGYFAARLGMEHTLLVVEKGTKLPSDWGGVLFIPLTDRTNMADVHLALMDAIKRIAPL